jgi:hypothetical protein
MHRAFGIDVLACAHCGGRLRLIATLHDPAVIRPRPSLGDYVTVTGPRGGAIAAGGC